MKRLTALVSVGLAILLTGCADRQSPEPASATAPATPPTAAGAAAPAATAAPATQAVATKTLKPLPDQHALHNGHYVTDKVLSGAQPEGEASFKELQRLGVKTVISVDGAAPDVEGAKKYGMEYVHLPITYASVTPEQGRAIAKAIAEKPGAVYVHCHHGKHRSAAAVAVACVYDGLIAPEQAEGVLKTFGTGDNYTGLWKAARDARPLDPNEIKQYQVEFVGRAKIGDMAEAMVHVDERFDHIKEIQKAGWQAPKDHPDIDPPHEALQLQELIHEMLRTDSKHAKDPTFRAQIEKADASAKGLHAALLERPVDTAKAETAFKAMSASCASCHKKYRD
jgi:protein tyrosine phosphatase (PTP) superfamily phosphohydrolase (DUF442 family)